MVTGASAADRYVSPTGSNIPPYASWATAAQVIQTAVDAAAAGETVWVAEGHYNTGGRDPGALGLTRVVIDKAITVKAVGSRTQTKIKGDSACRGVYMGAGATLAGFSIEDGTALASYGGNIYMVGQGIVSNCAVLRGNASQGGGVCLIGEGTLSDSYIDENHASSEGGGVYLDQGGKVERCRITRNIADLRGAGAKCANGSQLQRCHINGNVLGPIGENGIGAYLDHSYLENCVVAEHNGANASVYCMNDSSLFNCTISNNRQGLHGDGINSVYNSIIRLNFDSDWTGSSFFTFFNCCTQPSPAGSGNIDADPCFRSSEINSPTYYLQAVSPCIDMGWDEYAPATDIDGKPRPRDGNLDGMPKVDMGAYEFQLGSIQAVIEDAGAWDDSAHSTMAIVAADFNSDGHDDLAMANSFQANALFLGDGTGSFNPKPDGAGAFDDDGGFVQAHAIIALYANADAHVDLAVGNFTEPNELYINDGQGNFTLAACGAFGNESRYTVRLCALDVEPDGDMDIAELCYMSPSCVYTNNGAGRLDRAPDSDFTVGGRPGYSLAALDANNDGKMDLVAGYYGQACVLYTNGGNGRFWAKPAGELSTFVTTPLAMEVLDANNDGKANDLVVAGYEHANVIFTNNGLGSFTRVINDGDFGNQVTYTRSLKTCDFDNNGLVDIAVGNAGSPVEIFQNMGDGRFMKANISALSGQAFYAFGLAALDANHDGLRDLAIGNNQQPSKILKIISAQ